ncbi:MAG: hypothetical protein QM728_03490 [Gordonia sp. (in: high G+C Gram-positive bacteria)]|uniref:hypothetical protein n=1 Tax=Gordonia sp. (in: high G+C Gram-positive bacteria) TaxID=84139 RepID=UPI0039E5763B
MKRLPKAVSVLAALAVAAAPLTACAGSGGSDGELVGLFRFTPGAEKDGKLTGTWFRMLQPGGTVDNGPYMANANSPADGGKATLLEPGTSGGLRSGAYQSEPSPAFGAYGDSFADAIMKPTKFFGVKFGASTNRTDPQTRTELPPPRVTLKKGKLTADVSSWAASWNEQEFNQGAPKPVSSTGAKAPGQEKAGRAWDWVANKWLDVPPKANVTGDGATGTYDESTKRYTLTWTSHIKDGPFNGFTGVWHLEGVFEPTAAEPSAARQSSDGGGR